MISVNESIIQVWYKYQNIVKSFFFSGGAYKHKKRLKNGQKLSNASYTSFFSCVVPDFVWSFHNRDLDTYHKARELERIYLERNQA